jgi:hypothetical protein
MKLLRQDIASATGSAMPKNSAKAIASSLRDLFFGYKVNIDPTTLETLETNEAETIKLLTNGNNYFVFDGELTQLFLVNYDNIECLFAHHIKLNQL